MTSTPTRQRHSLTPAHPAYTLLARAHSPATASELFTTKIRQKPLLLRASSPPSSSDNRALRRHVRLRKKEYFLRKQKPRPLSAKQKRILGVHELKKDECKYAIYEGLHRLWVGYMQEVLGLKPSSNRNNVINVNNHGSLLASADYHGAEIEVVRSGCMDRVQLKGIVARDTKFTFVIVTSEDKVKSNLPKRWNLTIPKKDTIFRVEIPLPKNAEERVDTMNAMDAMDTMDVVEGDADSARPRNLVFELHGNQFEFRPADRANRKFKWKTMDYL